MSEKILVCKNALIKTDKGYLKPDEIRKFSGVTLDNKYIKSEKALHDTRDILYTRSLNVFENMQRRNKINKSDMTTLLNLSELNRIVSVDEKGLSLVPIIGNGAELHITKNLNTDSVEYSYDDLTIPYIMGVLQSYLRYHELGEVDINILFKNMGFMNKLNVDIKSIFKCKIPRCTPKYINRKGLNVRILTPNNTRWLLKYINKYCTVATSELPLYVRQLPPRLMERYIAGVIDSNISNLDIDTLNSRSIELKSSYNVFKNISQDLVNLLRSIGIYATSTYYTSSNYQRLVIIPSLSNKDILRRVLMSTNTYTREGIDLEYILYSDVGNRSRPKNLIKVLEAPPKRVNGEMYRYIESESGYVHMNGLTLAESGRINISKL